MIRNMSYSYDFETHRNLSYKQYVSLQAVNNPCLSRIFNCIQYRFKVFDLVLIQEYIFMSLALLVETLCWAVEDVIIEPTISWLDSIQPDAYQNKLSESSIRKVFTEFQLLDTN